MLYMTSFLGFTFLITGIFTSFVKDGVKYFILMTFVIPVIKAENNNNLL